MRFGWTTDNQATLLDMRSQGRTYQEIADAIGTTMKSVDKRVCKLLATGEALRQPRRRATGPKLCIGCGKQFPRTTEFFKINKDGGINGGRCRKCAYQKNRDKQLAKSKPYYQANREKIIARSAARYEAKRTEILEQERLKRLVRGGPDEHRNKRQRERRKENPKIRLNRAVSGYIRTALHGEKRGRKWESVVGYTLEDLMRHLERQFSRGITWKNYGSKWHVDHIIPISWFNFSSPDDDEFKACWAITNLRPLPVKKNLSKSGKRELLL